MAGNYNFDLQLEDNTAVDGVIQQYSCGSGIVWKAQPSVIPSNGGSSKAHAYATSYANVKGSFQVLFVGKGETFTVEFGLDGHGKAFCNVIPSPGCTTLCKKSESNTGGQTMTAHINFYDP